MEVRTAATLTSLAPARMLQRSSQLVWSGGKPETPAMVAASVKDTSQGLTQQPTMGMTIQTRSEDQNLGKMSMSANVVATLDPQENSKQSYTVNGDDQRFRWGSSMGQQKEKLQMVHNTLVRFLMP